MRTQFYFTVLTLLFLAALFISGCTAEYRVELSAEPEHAGEVTGGGVYTEGTDIAIKAEAYEGYEFKYWKENDTKLSTSWNYPFIVRDNRNLVAVFEEVD